MSRNKKYLLAGIAVFCIICLILKQSYRGYVIDARIDIWDSARENLYPVYVYAVEAQAIRLPGYKPIYTECEIMLLTDEGAEFAEPVLRNEIIAEELGQLLPSLSAADIEVKREIASFLNRLRSGQLPQTQHHWHHEERANFKARITHLSFAKRIDPPAPGRRWRD